MIEVLKANIKATDKAYHEAVAICLKNRNDKTYAAVAKAEKEHNEAVTAYLNYKKEF